MSRAKGEGSVYQRADGKWVASVEAGVRISKDGKPTRRRVRRVRDTRKAAVAALADLQREVRRQLPDDLARQTVEQYLTWWVEQLPKTRRASTVRNYTSDVKLHLVPRIGRLRLDKLGIQHVQQVLDDLAATGLAPKTVAEVRGTLRVALNQAIDWGILDTNVAERARPPRQEKHEIVPLTHEEAIRLFEVLAGDRVAGVYLLAALTAARQGEVLGLRWSDVKLWTETDPDTKVVSEHGEIRLRKQLQRVDGEYVLEDLKTDRSKRALSLPKIAIAALHERRRAERREKLKAANWASEFDAWGLVWRTKVGRPVNGSWTLHHLQDVCNDNDLPRIRFHDLRHTAASLLLEHGEDLKVISETLGHSTIRLTADTYSHVSAKLRRRVAGRMDDMFGTS